MIKHSKFIRLAFTFEVDQVAVGHSFEKVEKRWVFPHVRLPLRALEVLAQLHDVDQELIPEV